MKKGIGIWGIAALAATLTACTSAYYASSGAAADDLYAVHNRTEIARRQQAEAEARKAEAEARRAEIEALIAQADADAAAYNYRNGTSGSSYSSVLADTYESAYARRLRGFNSASYRMPSSYINARYSPTFTYVSAYDPAFYNVMIMGDEVWVEPKYVTAMFGTWGLPSYSSAWYYGWPSYSSWWGPSAFSIGFGGWGWNVGLSWYDPWWGISPWHYNWAWSHGWGWRPGWGWGHPHYAHGGYPGGAYRPGWGVVHRPAAPRGTNVYGGSRNGQINRSQSGNRNWSSGVYQGGGNANNRGGQNNRNTTTRSGSSSNGYNNSGSNTNNSQRRSSGSGYSSPGSGSRSGGYSGSNSGGYSSGGGSSRGGYSGSSSRGR